MSSHILLLWRAHRVNCLALENKFIKSKKQQTEKKEHLRLWSIIKEEIQPMHRQIRWVIICFKTV